MARTISSETQASPVPPSDAIWDRFWQAVEQIQARNDDLDSDDVLRHVTEVVEEVRQERYERAHPTKDGR